MEMIVEQEFMGEDKRGERGGSITISWSPVPSPASVRERSPDTL